jgi:hypothetical protein
MRIVQTSLHLPHSLPVTPAGRWVVEQHRHQAANARTTRLPVVLSFDDVVCCAGRAQLQEDGCMMSAERRNELLLLLAGFCG